MRLSTTQLSSVMMVVAVFYYNVQISELVLSFNGCTGFLSNYS